MSNKDRELLSQFYIGQPVLYNPATGVEVKAHVRVILFTNMKVRYSLFLEEHETTVHNVDSVFVETDTDTTRQDADFGEDNYS